MFHWQLTRNKHPYPMPLFYGSYLSPFWVARTRCHSLGGLQVIEMYCSQFSGYKSEIGVPAWLGEGPLLGLELLVVCRHSGRVCRTLWGLYKSPYPIHKGLWPNHLPKALPLIPSPLGIKISADEFGFRLQQLIIIFCTSFPSSYFCLAKFQPRINPALHFHHASTWELNMSGENAHPDGSLLVKCTTTNLPKFFIQLAKLFFLIHSLCLDNYFTPLLTSLLKPLTLPSCILPLCR